MSFYSIKEIEQLSGIKAHTLRIWEQRYDFIKPKRTCTNIRYYDDEDLKLVLNVAFLKDNGLKISRICDMSDEDLRAEVQRLMDRKTGFPEQIQGLTLAMLELDEDSFEKILSTNILRFGLERTMLNLIYPFFNKIGVLWQTGAISPVQEHFISNLIRQKLIVAIDGQIVNNGDAKNTFLLFLPENELHEISLLFSAYILKSRTNRVIYLGQNVPHNDLKDIYHTHKPEYLLTVMTTFPTAEQIQDYVNELSSSFNHSSILISGPRAFSRELNTPSNVKLLKHLNELIDLAAK